MKVTIYTQNSCQHTPAEKTYLQSKGIQFEEKNVETNKAFLDEMMKVGNNFAGTPVTKIEKGDGTSVVLKGFTQAEFDKELSSAPAAAPSASAPAAAMPSAPTAPVMPESPTPSVGMANLDVKMPDVTQPAAPAPTPAAPTEPVTPPQPTTPPTPMPTEPTPPAPTPTEPTTPVIPAAEPTPETPSAPPVQQANNPLDAILADLQSKTGDAPQPTQPTPPTPAPTDPAEPTPTPATPPVTPPTPGMDMPTPPTPAAGGMPTVPDFPTK